MDPDAPRGGGLRYRVTFRLMHPHPPCSYEVATLHGEPKAVVLATRAHETKGRGHILAVEVEPLSGACPAGSDLIDRLEW